MARRSVNAAARRAFRFKGLDELQAELGNLVRDVGGQSLGSDIKDVFYRAAVELRDEAKRTSAFADKTGALRQGIFAAKGDTNKPSALAGVSTRTAPHAHLVEFGHAGPHPAPPHPFMRPAVAAKKERINQVISDGLKEIVRRYSK